MIVENGFDVYCI